MMNTRQQSIAITGANGFLGSALVEYFAKKGWKVIALARKPPAGKPVHKNISYLSYDLSVPINVEAMNKVDYLIHTAYVKHDRKHPESYEVNINAAEDIMSYVRKNNIKKIIFISSMSAHKQAKSSYGQQKLAIEKIFKGPKFINIRSGLIIGNGGIVMEMIGFMRSKHLVPLVDGGKQPLQIISVDDLVVSIDNLLASELYGTYTLANPEIYSYKQLYFTISKILSIKVILVPMPYVMLINLIRLADLLPISIAISPDNIMGLRYLKAVNTTEDIKKIGVKLKNLDEALGGIK
jgi:nucleoside-diphosphate-sugar epimerase